MDAFIKKTDQFCSFLEKRTGLVLTSFILAAIILLLGMLYITPKFEAAYHGLQYALLSNNPFDFATPNPLRYRILPSLIGYVTGLRGDLFFIVPLLFALLFIASLYWVYRKKKYSTVDALLFTGLISFSCTLYIQLAAPGYTDVVFYFFMFLSFASVRKIWLSALFFMLALLTHESCLFLLPGLILYAAYVNSDRKSPFVKYTLAYLLALIPLLLYRYWVKSHAPVEYDLGFYFSAKNIGFSLTKVLPLFPAGAFFAFKLFWFFPVYALYVSYRSRDYRFMLIIVCILVCDALQLVIAFDITRMLCLGFPAILIAAEKTKATWDAAKFTRFAFILTILNFFIIQYFMTCDGIVPMLPSPYTFLLDHIFIP